jgi:hypothetical protein
MKRLKYLDRVLRDGDEEGDLGRLGESGVETLTYLDTYILKDTYV